MTLLHHIPTFYTGQHHSLHILRVIHMIMPQVKSTRTGLPYRGGALSAGSAKRSCAEYQEQSIRLYPLEIILNLNTIQADKEISEQVHWYSHARSLPDKISL